MDEELNFLEKVKNFVHSELNERNLGLDQVRKLTKVYGPNDLRVKKAKLEVFFRAYSVVGTVSFAAQIAGLNPRSVKKLIQENPKVAARFDQAHDEFCQFLEQAAIIRALRKSDTLLTFLLRANNPRKFSERLRLQQASEAEEKPLSIVFGDVNDPNYARTEGEANGDSG